MRLPIPLIALVLALTTGCAQPPGRLIRVSPPIEVIEAERLRDGGSLRVAFTDETKQTFTALMDYRTGGFRGGQVRWVPPDYNNTVLMPRGGDLERDLADVLEGWMEAKVSPQARDTLSKTNEELPPLEPVELRQAWVVSRMVATIRKRAERSPGDSVW